MPCRVVSGVRREKVVRAYLDWVEVRARAGGLERNGFGFVEILHSEAVSMPHMLKLR